MGTLHGGFGDSVETLLLNQTFLGYCDGGSLFQFNIYGIRLCIYRRLHQYRTVSIRYIINARSYRKYTKRKIYNLLNIILYLYYLTETLFHCLHR